MSKNFFDTTVINKLRNKEKVSAAWCQMNSAISSEIIAEAGFDVAVIDVEHAHTTLPQVISMIQSTKGSDCVPFVRAPWNDIVWIKQLLDCGVYGIHIPYVQTKEEAEAAVSYCKYPPLGVRGIAMSHRAVNFGMNRADYFNRANEDVIVIIAVETPRGVDNIEEIAAVEGVDGIFIGPADLATSMGYLANPSEPKVQEAIKTIEKAVFKTDKFLSTVAPNADAAQKLYDRGYGLIYMMSDIGACVKAAQTEVGLFREHNINS